MSEGLSELSKLEPSSPFILLLAKLGAPQGSRRASALDPETTSDT